MPYTLKTEHAQAIAEMVADGCAVIIYTPDALGGADPRACEDEAEAAVEDYLANLAMKEK